MMAQGHDWCRVPCELTQRWIMLLRGDEVSSAKAAELVTCCDELRSADFDPGFFAMSDMIREWYRATYEAELAKAFGNTNV
jgi:hypothetical protein